MQRIRREPGLQSQQVNHHMDETEYKSPPEEYSGSSDLEVYETFITGILQWLRLHGLLGVNYTETQVQFLGM